MLRVLKYNQYLTAFSSTPWIPCAAGAVFGAGRGGPHDGARLGVKKGLMDAHVVPKCMFLCYCVMFTASHILCHFGCGPLMFDTWSRFYQQIPPEALAVNWKRLSRRAPC